MMLKLDLSAAFEGELEYSEDAPTSRELLPAGSAEAGVGTDSIDESRLCRGGVGGNLSS